MPHLLFVDDDKSLLALNQEYFESRGFSVALCENAKLALDYINKYPVDCVILDIMMPGIDGFELCRYFKSRITAPIIFLTSYIEKEYLYQGFHFGGDDFLTKPCDLRELEIRINIRISQSIQGHLKAEIYKYPPLTINSGSREVYINDIKVPLTGFEFDILLLLARNPDHVFSLKTIYHEIWKLPDLENAKTVKVHVARMRHKLETACPNRKFIGTVWKQGYRFIVNDKENFNNEKTL